MKVFTVLGPSHSGKTTLVDGLATLEGSKPVKLGLYGDASVTRFDFMDEQWAALDTPGGSDNLACIGPALAASDAAVLCVPAEVDAAVLAAPYLRILEASNVPTFIFINRVDAASDRISDIVSALQVYCAHGIVLRQVPIRSGNEIVGAVDLISERAWEYHEQDRSSLVELPDGMRQREEEARTQLLESLADFDDTLLEQLIEDQRPMTDEVYEVATRVLQHHDLVPALLGAASHGNGIMRLMKSLRHEVPGIKATLERESLPKGAAAIGCLADNVKHLGKTILLRALTDNGVSAGGQLGGETVGGLVDIDGRTQVASLRAGELGLALKSDHLNAGACFTSERVEELPGWAAPNEPNYQKVVSPAHEKDEARLANALARMTEVDPGLKVRQDEQSGQPIIHAQGPLHLRRVVEMLDQTFGIKVTTDEVPPAFRETISKGMEKHYRHRKQSGGAGQFADVLIEVRPLPRGTGFRFEEQIKGGAVPKNYIPAVEAGARDAITEGPNGNPVVDISVLLKDGKHHAVDSSDFAFRTAGKNGLREALSELGTVVLQPICRVEIHVPTVFAGGLVPLISSMKGQVLGFEPDSACAGWDVFKALLPKAAEPELFNALGGATRGTASYSSEFDHYEETRQTSRAAAPAAG